MLHTPKAKGNGWHAHMGGPERFALRVGWSRRGEEGIEGMKSPWAQGRGQAIVEGVGGQLEGFSHVAGFVQTDLPALSSGFPSAGVRQGIPFRQTLYIFKVEENPNMLARQ